MNSKQKYIEYCNQLIESIPIFSQPFWLDAVAENWDISLIINDDGKIIAALPYCWKGNLFTKRIYLPDVSFYQSALFFSDVDKNSKQKLTEQLIQQLPKTVKSYFKFLPEHSAVNLSKSGFTKEDYATYIISTKQEMVLSSNHKRNVQKGNKLHYIVKESKNSEASFALLTSTFARQNIQSKITFADFKKLNSFVKKHQVGKTIDCLDEQKNLLASVFIVEDANAVYYLFGGYNTAYKNSGAMTFLLHDVIQAARNQQKDFNFCGSSKKSIAAYFEGFGATQQTISIWKKGILS